MINKNLFLAFRTGFGATFAVIALALVMSVNAFATYYVGGTVYNENSTAAAPHNYVVGATVCAKAGGVDVVCADTTTGGTYYLYGLSGGVAYEVHVSKAAYPRQTAAAYIDSDDYNRLATHINNTNPFATDFLKWAADVSGNGTISTFDQGKILAWTQSTGDFAHTGEWRFTPEEEGCPWPASDASVSRYYLNLTASLDDQDFDAIVKGEVTGDWVSQ
jgi:hypothetical protein